MYVRSQFLNHAVCVTITTAAVVPMMSVRTMIEAWRNRRAVRISKRLTDAEMHAPAPLRDGGILEQQRDRIELPPDVESNRTDRRLIPQAGADGIAQIARLDAPAVGPDVAAVHEQHAAEIPAQHGAQLRADGKHAVAAERQAGSAERADLIA